MIHSDWEDWLPKAVDTANPSGVRLWYLGCNGMILKASDGTTLFVDPYLGTGDPPRTIRMIPIPFEPTDVTEAAAILATHEHTDHVHGPSQAPILAETGADYIAPGESLAVTDTEEWCDRWDVDQTQFRRVKPGDALTIGDVDITVTPANDPDATEPVSYVFKHGGCVVFHGGDGRQSESFQDIGSQHDIDLAMLAFGSKGAIPDKETNSPTPTEWYNDENAVVDAARELRATRLLPTHWDMWKGLTADPTALHDHVRSFDWPKRLEILEIGDSTEV